MSKIPEDLKDQHRIFSTGKNVRPTAEEHVKLIERIARLEADNERLSAPVSGEEMNKFAIHHIQVVQPHRTLPVLTHDSADRLIAARKEGSRT